MYARDTRGEGARPSLCVLNPRAAPHACRHVTGAPRTTTCLDNDVIRLPSFSVLVQPLHFSALGLAQQGIDGCFLANCTCTRIELAGCNQLASQGFALQKLTCQRKGPLCGHKLIEHPERTRTKYDVPPCLQDMHVFRTDALSKPVGSFLFGPGHPAVSGTPGSNRSHALVSLGNNGWNEHYTGILLVVAACRTVHLQVRSRTFKYPAGNPPAPPA